MLAASIVGLAACPTRSFEFAWRAAGLIGPSEGAL
jgi:hypothetical protein